MSYTGFDNLMHVWHHGFSLTLNIVMLISNNVGKWQIHQNDNHDLYFLNPFCVIYNGKIGCIWGHVFDFIANELRQTIDGQLFFHVLSSDKLDVDNEASCWNHFVIYTYELQWQNYKYIGVTNTNTIVNAYGGQYSCTIQSTSGEYRSRHQTTFKMYWGLGNDLNALSNNMAQLWDR
ncbi:hypothetical protein THRCLA_22065 [Thraustotheca clavata]|uniref:Uncharacterized protein n=1 Tax=Thraustotheca clavata TaxID=74557 RepID=A0A1V9ZD19_9STRA|nr:hypothetical protein THRCLA_22065 [Thraustotheca clavata]